LSILHPPEVYGPIGFDLTPQAVTQQIGQFSIENGVRVIGFGDLIIVGRHFSAFAQVGKDCFGFSHCIV
jgi:hypothetical protein